MRIPLSPLFLIGALLFGFYAQVNAAPPLAMREVNLRFTVTANTQIEPIAFVPAPRKTTESLTFYTSDRSPTYTYKGEEILKFYPEGFSAETSAPVAMCLIPEGMTKALLLFFPRQTPSANGLKYDVVAVDDSVKTIPVGQFSIINISGREYAAQFGDAAPVMISQGISPAFEANGRTTIKLARQDQGEWAPAGRHVFTITPQARVWVLIYPPASATDVYPVIRRLSEHVPATPTGAAVVARYP